MRIDFLGLQAFMAIAERGSFQMAAAYLNLSQTALSHRIRRIEHDLGVKLFVRTTRRVSLTPAGRELLPKVRELIGDLSTAMDDVRRRGMAAEQRIVIACLPTVAAVVLGPALFEFHKLYPDVSVKVHDKSATEILELLSDGAVEFAVTISTPLRMDFHIQALRKDPLVLVARNEDIPEDTRHVGWSDLADVPLIRMGPHIGSRLDEALGGRRERLTWRYELQHASIAIAFVRAGLGMTVVPRLALRRQDLDGLRVVELHDPTVSRQIGIVTKREVALSPMTDQLRKLIVRQFQRMSRDKG
jgi:DNA-binding transcriptional LysR family regulator